MPVSTYSPALTREENERVEALVERLQSIQKVEDDLRKQIRKIIYKIEKPR